MADHGTTAGGSHGNTLTVIVVTPERTALETQAEFVVLPLFDGELGIAHNHAPLIGRLGYGELRIRKSGETEYFYLDGGFVQVANNAISILTGRAVPAAKIDVSAAERSLVESMYRPVPTDVELELRDKAVTRARGQLKVASHVNPSRAAASAAGHH